MKCSKCGKEIINIQKASCISGYDEKGKHENWLCEKCSSEWDKEHPCYPIDYVKKSITDFVCKKCGSTEYEIKDKPNGTGIAHGLYCAKCGFWHKWLNKEELKQYGKKDSNGEIFSRLQAENAELKIQNLTRKQNMNDIDENVLKNGKPEIKKKIEECLSEFIDGVADEMWEMLSEIKRLEAAKDAAEKRLAELGGEKK